jgi:hypothetical protein
MARLLALIPALGGVLGLSGALFLSPSSAQSPPEMMNAAPGATAPPANPPPPAPPVPEDYFARYGKILSPNNQPSYPFKLTMPAPGFGEVKIPNASELAMREKLEGLAMLSDAEIRDQLEKWPAYGKMSLGDQGAMLTRIQQFRDFRTKMAAMKAHQLGLLTLNPAQQVRFEQEFWDKRLAMDHQLAQQFEPVYKAAQEKLNEDLYREFSSPGGLVNKPAAANPAGPVMKVSSPPAAAQ